jgi:hypothetical protein
MIASTSNVASERSDSGIRCYCEVVAAARSNLVIRLDAVRRLSVTEKSKGGFSKDAGTINVGYRRGLGRLWASALRLELRCLAI